MFEQELELELELELEILIQIKSRKQSAIEKVLVRFNILVFLSLQNVSQFLL